METKRVMLSGAMVAGMASLAFAGAFESWAIVLVPMSFVVARWGLGRGRHPVPEAWFETR